MASRHFRKEAQIFTLGAAFGFLAGALAVGVVIWRFAGVPTALPFAEKPRVTAERQGGADSDSPVLQSEVDSGVGTSGSSSKAAETGPTISAPPAAELSERDLSMPVDGIVPRDLVNSFHDDRGGRQHEAIDIMAPKGTPVRAVEDGRVARLFISKAGGITVYQFDPSERFCYYYAHLDRYADGLRENDRVKRGQIIGYVGVSGNAPKNTPHLHFAIFRLSAEKHWWEGTPIDPYPVLR